MKNGQNYKHQLINSRILLFRFSVVMILWFFFQITLPAQQHLYEVGDVHEPSIKLIRGQWIVGDSQFLFEFTNQPVKKIYGLKYYSYQTLPRSRSRIFIFTIIKSKKTGRLYFARGKLQDGGFVGSVSRLRFIGKNKLIVYKKDKHNEVYFTAKRKIR